MVARNENKACIQAATTAITNACNTTFKDSGNVQCLQIAFEYVCRYLNHHSLEARPKLSVICTGFSVLSRAENPSFVHSFCTNVIAIGRLMRINL